MRGRNASTHCLYFIAISDRVHRSNALSPNHMAKLTLSDPMSKAPFPPDHSAVPEQSFQGRAFAQLQAGRVQLFGFREIEGLEELWQDLETNGTCGPYQRLEWIRSWLTTLGQNAATRPVMVSVHARGRPVGLLPLAVTAKGTFQILTFAGQNYVNQNTGLWADNAEAEFDPTELLAALRGLAGKIGADLVQLNNLASGPGGSDNPLYLAACIPSVHPLFETALSGSFDELFRQTHKKESRKKLLRKERGLRESGAFSIEKASSSLQIETALSAFFAQRSAREKNAGIPNAFGSKAEQDFVRKLASEPDIGTAPLSVWSLNVAGKVRAVFLTVRTASHLSGYAISFSEDDLSVYSPGLVLLKNVLQTEMQTGGLLALDLGIGDERYKRSWTNPVQLKDLVCATSAKGTIALTALKALQAVKTRVRRSKKLWPMVRKMRQRLARSSK
ncbi:CelD/BcsL family acetyltransferase involved in cellulose biosynthesis [Roseibium hamelinense]|uniref:CelD/BcsL family acetyltransferase involved in cellulose biosynthesis n=2 Tax=Roseibium hamelinense TaxID=150831 RepID=A0A562TGH1_9HYPH|nr:CelD/BcsL family acetyltransferase involved in cellulose biosynthesis [Roseibium hamelinense]